ncbi:hypothetical protein C8J56DRAFT_480739 [Mycena floridula]|nr:hypothetical protein C8J56DRAFT_480739 [Mycena floridula]
MISVKISTPISATASLSTPTRGNPVQYRIEERTRTVFVTTDLPPSEWDTETVNQIFSASETPIEAPEFGILNVARSRSLTERDIFVFADGTSSAQDPYRQQIPARPHSECLTGSKHSPPGSPPKSPRPRILFYHSHDPHYGFTNFSPHPVFYEGKRYPTSEHLFQSFKFHGHRPNLAEHIRTCSERPSVAFAEARRFQPEVRRDWKKVNIAKMDQALWHKFTQHYDLQQELLATGDAELVEDSDKDAFWGVGADRRGRNELGKALERLRSKLREGFRSID